MRWFSFQALPLRWKMTLAALTPLTFILMIVAVAAAWVINAWVVDQAQKQIRNDLNAAREVFNNEQSRIENVVRFTAQSKELSEAATGVPLQALGLELLQVRQREGLDLLNFVAINGHSRSQGLPFVKQVLQGKIFSGTVLLSAEALRGENPELAGRSIILLQDAAEQKTEETRGMLIVSAVPVHSAEGQVIGCLYGGVLLNNNLAFIDRIHDVIYSAGEGSATIFLDRTRATTTILLKNGERAIGTFVSEEVAEAVLEHGNTWLARARVVDEWYLTAYEPIRDYRGQPVGALYVGLLEAPFSGLKRRASLLLVGLLALGCGSGYLLAHYVARRIARPIVKLEDSARRIASGERDVPLPETDDDEVGLLTTSFRHMTAALKSNEEELNRLNQELERKVFKRTSELEAKSVELMRTQQDLLRAEKLAAIGELASGVAHEINNPAAIIRGNIELLLDQLPDDHPARDEAEEILKQTERVSRITHNMLTFAREQQIKPEQVYVNKILEDVLAQVRHQEPLQDVDIETDLDQNIPPVMADAERLRQVFTNIVLNALQALEGQGKLKVTSRVEGSDVEIRFEDNGPGIAENIKEKVFNPFFTTKSTGTGLGLSVSYGIIKALKGSLSVQNNLTAGATFKIVLPLA